MAGGELIRFYGTTGSGGSADGQSQPDKTLWLGRYRASQRLDEIQSTLTSAQVRLHRFVDTARIGDGVQAHQMKWVLIQTGPAAMSPARVMSFNNSTGEFILDRATLALGQAGDYYAVFDVENVFPSVTAAQASAGQTLYRCIAVRNESGVTLTNARLRFRVLNLEPYQMGAIWNTVNSMNFLYVPDQYTSPLNDNGHRIVLGGADLFTYAPGEFQRPFVAMKPYFGNQGHLTTRALFLRREIAANTPYRASVALLVSVESDTTGQDPDPLVGGAIIAFDVAGPTYSTELEVDRYVHINGGCRLNGTIISAVTGEPIENLLVKYQIEPGDDGTLVVANNPTTGYEITDEYGRVGATYIAPTNPALEGDAADLQMVIPNGDEVGDPGGLY